VQRRIMVAIAAGRRPHGTAQPPGIPPDQVRHHRLRGLMTASTPTETWGGP
jgi:hypothetical protein